MTSTARASGTRDPASVGAADPSSLERSMWFIGLQKVLRSRRRLSVRQRTEALALQESLRFLVHDLITLASTPFETLAVEDREPPPRVGDEAGLLQHAGSLGHARAAHAEHLGHELLREHHLVRAGAIVRHQE